MTNKTLLDGLDLIHRQRKNKNLKYGASKLEFMQHEEDIIFALKEGYSKTVIFEYLKSIKKLKMGKSIFFRYAKKLTDSNNLLTTLEHHVAEKSVELLESDQNKKDENKLISINDEFDPILKQRKRADRTIESFYSNKPILDRKDIILV